MFNAELRLIYLSAVCCIFTTYNPVILSNLMCIKNTLYNVKFASATLKLFILLIVVCCIGYSSIRYATLIRYHSPSSYDSMFSSEMPFSFSLFRINYYSYKFEEWQKLNLSSEL